MQKRVVADVLARSASKDTANALAKGNYAKEIVLLFAKTERNSRIKSKRDKKL